MQHRTIGVFLFVFLTLNVLFTGTSSAKLVEVKVRKGDTLHGFASKYLKDLSHWPRIYEINKKTIKDPDKIYPGQIIKIPVEMLKDKIGDISNMLNLVKIRKREGNSWRKGNLGERLFPEDGIMTDDKSFARVDFLVGSYLEIFEKSLIYLRPTEKKTAVASLLSGGLNVKQAKILTPSAEVIPKGETVYDIDVDEKKSTKISVRDGEVDVKAKGETVTVFKGYRTLVEYDKSPQKPVKLPLDGEEALEYEDQIRKNKDLYFNLQVSMRRDFATMIRNEMTQDISMENIKKDLSPGQYYWRVAMLDKDGFRGGFCRVKGFVIRDLISGALVSLTNFEIVDRDEGIMRIKGIAKHARSVVINGYPADLDNDGRFKTSIILAADQKTITVTAISSEGVVIRKYHRTDAGEWLPVK